MAFTDLAEERARAYALERPRYEAYCNDIRRIMQEVLCESAINIHSIESRAKAVDSYRKKSVKTNSSGALKYNAPLKQITDLAAVRVIVFTTSYVQKVGEVIDRTFAVEERKDLGEERSQSKDFGYQSVHYLVSHRPERLKLPDYRKFSGMICEIQVRTILQHAWAEIEHDIQYKSANEIPREIGRKFRALAGLIEIADREFQSIQDTDFELKDSIQRSVANALTRVIHEDAKAVQQGNGAEVKDKAKAELTVLSSARELILERDYEGALKIFDANIAAKPNAHTQYIGRAKLRFLLGDRSGALEDLDQAGKFVPGDPAIASVRLQIEQGTARMLSGINAVTEYTAGRKALSEGLGEEAFVHFSNAQEAGHNLAFSILNKAIACVLVGDLTGGRAFLDELQRRRDTPMEVNIVALNCIIDILDSGASNAIPELTGLLKKMTDFNLKLSPLFDLKKGMIARKSASLKAVKPIFDLLGRETD